MLNIPEKHDTRAAFTIVELMAAIVIIGLCIATFAKIAHTARQQRQNGHTYQTAIDQLQNTLELLGDVDPEQLAAGGIDLSQCEAFVARSLPDGKLTVTCEPLAVDVVDDIAAADAVQTWRLDASVTWYDGEKCPQPNVTLTRLLSKPRPGIETPEEAVEETPEGGAE